MKQWISLIALSLALAACGPQNSGSSFKELPEGPIKHQLIALAWDKDGITARGLAKSTPKNTTVFCEVGKSNARTTSGDDGSFIITLKENDRSLTAGELNFTTEGKNYLQAYKIKDLTKELANMAQEPLKTGKDIDSLAFFPDRVAILSSSAALVQLFPLDQFWNLEPTATKSILVNQSTLEPVGARKIGRFRNFLLGALADTHELALLDPDHERLISRKKLLMDNGQPYLFDVQPALTVKIAIDALGDGVKTTSISKTFARNLEVVHALSDDLILVGFSNYYQMADWQSHKDSVVGPGILALLAFEDDQFKVKQASALPFKNPAYFLDKDKNTVWVSCSGAFKYSGTILTSNDGGLLRLKIDHAAKSFSVDHQIALGDFTPAEPSLMGDQILIPRSWSDELLVLNENALAISPSDIKKSDVVKDLTFTSSAPLDDDIALLGDARGRLVAFSIKTGFFPFPFVEPIPLRKQVTERVDTPISLYLRHRIENRDLADYKKGYDVWVLTADHLIFRLNLMTVFGP